MVTDDNKYRTKKDKDPNGKKKKRKSEIREDFNSENVQQHFAKNVFKNFN